MSASPGALGGMRSLAVLRTMLENIGVLVIPAQVAVSAAHQAFAADGSFTDPKHGATVKNLAAKLVETTTKLKA